MTNFNDGRIKFNGDVDEMRRFPFRILLDNVVYYSLYEDGYIQCIENVISPSERPNVDTILEISEIVENWFVVNENKAWWIENGAAKLEYYRVREMTGKAYRLALLFLAQEIEMLKVVLKNKDIKDRESLEESLGDLETDFDLICHIERDFT